MSARGPKPVAIELRDEDREQLEAGRAGAARRPGWPCAHASCWPPPGGVPTARSRASCASGARRWASGGALRREGPGRPARRAASRPAAEDRRRSRRATHRAHPGESAAGRRHALVNAPDGGGERPLAGQRLAHLAALACSPTASSTGNCPRTRSLSRRCATSSASTSIRRSAHSCSASTRRARSRRWTGVSRSCRCCPAVRRQPPATTCATAPQACLPPSIPPRAESSAHCTPATGR